MAARPHIFRRHVLRSIRGSLGRFLAVMGISALGCGFYAGLQMCGPDMRDAADRWYDGTNLWDLRVVSTMGLAEADLTRIAGTAGVEQAELAKTCDVMVSLGDEQIAVRITSIDVDAARASEQDGLYAVTSDAAGYLNRPMLREGRWPEAAGECVISADAVEGFAVGDTVEVLYGTDDLDDVLALRRFRVVGTVSASDYPYTGNFGSTTLGSGMIDEYLYVREDAFAVDFPYVEAYLRVAGAAGELSESAAYDAAVDVVQADLESREDTLARARREDLVSDAQAELDEAWDEYRQERADAEAELADAAAELADAHAELNRGEAAWEQGRSERDAGARELASQRATAEAQLADAQQQIDAGQAELDENRTKLAASAAQVEEVRSQLPEFEAKDAALAAQEGELAITVDALTTQLSELDTQLAAIEGQLAAVDPTSAEAAELAGMCEGLVQARPGIAGGLERAAAGLEQVRTGRADIAAAREAVATYDAGVAAAAQAQAELDAARAELAARRAQATRELDAAQSRLDAASRELAASRSTLDAGWVDYRDGQAEYDDARAEAETSFAEAEEELADAQAEIDDIDLPDLYVLDRSQSEGAATYHADAGRIDSIADVFPLIFFLVAALVSLTTMTRMVEDDRIEIGTYKALGFSTATIASKYLAYAAIAATTGAALGIAVLSQVLPFIVISSYGIIYAVPLLPAPLPVDPGIALAAGGMGVGVTLLATWAAVVSSLRSTPASLMLPRAPKAGKRILLERVSPLWSRITFTGKVTLRNLFRYKRRLAMTVVGIAGCTALLLVGFGLHDSIWDIIDCQYGPIVHYDTTVGLSDGATQAQVETVRAAIEDAGGSGIQVAHLENMQAGSASYEGTLRLQAVVPADAVAFGEAITFKERLSQEELVFDDDQVILTEKASSLLGVGMGDELLLYEQDNIGNASGEPHALIVTAVMENYVGNLVYVGRNAWEAAFGEELRASAGEDEASFATLYFSRDPEAGTASLSATLHDLDGVSTVVFTDETIDTYRSMLSVIDLIVVVLIVSAALLALIVLYNLTNINIGERIREIASLKVLGFTRHEVHSYIFRETALLSLLGDALGMLLGTWLERFVVITAEVDYVMFGRTIHAPSYACAFALTLVFTALVLLLMRRKLDRIDMVESLKSVE